MEFEILGQNSEGNGRTRLLMVAGVAVLVLIALRRGGSASPPPAGEISDSRIAEFQRITADAEQDMRRLTATNDLRRYELDLSHSNSPAGLRECWTGEQWEALPRDVRRSIKSQAKRSGTLLVAGPGGGFCTLPTGRGVRGDLQAVQRSSSGLLGGSSSGIGAPAPVVQRPGILDAWDAYVGARYGGGR